MCLTRLALMVTVAASVLSSQAAPDRPWAKGLGLHLDPSSWRLQIMPAAAFLDRAPEGAGLPAALHRAPVPTVLIHLNQLRPGLHRLSTLLGGTGGELLRTAGAGSRAGFLINHLQAWMDKAQGAVGPLEGREAWVLHYGQRGEGAGTLAFLPGPLPARAEAALGLLRFNPFSAGARVRQVRLQDGTPVDMVRASGGQLYLEATSQGTWIADRLDLLEEAHRVGKRPILAERQEWGRLAMAGAEQAQVSLWMVPRAGASAAFETALIQLRSQPRSPKPVGIPFAKGAPRGSALSLALGEGPTRAALHAMFHMDSPFEPPLPGAPAFTDGGSQLTPAQRRDREAAMQTERGRREAKAALRSHLDRLAALLAPGGAAFHWNGWTPAPPLPEREKAALSVFRKHGWWLDGTEKRKDAPGYGGYGEPGFTPSLALALPLQPGKGAEADDLMKRILGLAFRGTVQAKDVGGVTFRRARVEQAFAPTVARVGNTLVLASDDRAALATVAGLQGQAPTLADLPASTWGQAELDGPRLAGELESLLLAYLGTRASHPRRWWEPPAPGTADEVAEEVASTFGPFLDLIRAQGRVGLELRLVPGGIEARPR